MYLEHGVTDMNETPIEKNSNNESKNLPNQDVKQKTATPKAEHKKWIHKRRIMSLLFALLLLVEAAIVQILFNLVFADNLHNRVLLQIENQTTGHTRFETGIYTGETDFGYLTGEGTFEFVSGTTYTGHWYNNEMNGLGVLNIPNEGTYTGEFIDSQKTGRGVFNWEDGAFYDGEWKNDQMDGFGTYNSPNSITYTGIFKENVFRDGICEFKNETGSYTVTYKASAIDNLEINYIDGTQYSGATDGITLCGTGTMTFPNGDHYSGKFDEGLRNGQGVYTWSNGDEYNGIWEDDAMSGNGKYTFADGSYAHGTFENNCFIDGSYFVQNSFGTYTFTIKEQNPVAIDMSLANGTKYSGDMKSGKLTGTAQITYSNGDQYSGRVSDGYKSGQGTYTWKSGASYDGNWKNDKMDGQGTYLYPAKDTGYKLSGSFENGVPNGVCWYYVTSSESYKTDWKNGKCVKVYE